MRRPVLILTVLGCACSERPDSAPGSDTISIVDSLRPAAGIPAAEWNVRRLDSAPPRFRPGGWSDQRTLWGIVRDRVTRLDVETGATRTLDATAWSLHTARDRVSWRNGDGTWLLGANGQPVRIAGPQPDSLTGFDGPPTILWSPAGRALLGWHGEGGSRYELLTADGARRALQTRIPGYAYDAPVLWLDSVRVLFQTVANAPLAGEPMHRESGWRGDLAVLDLRAQAYTRVTSVPDRVYLRAASSFSNGVLVAEWDSAGLQRHWVYDPTSWQRRPIDLPKGRAFSNPAGAIIVLLDSPGDTTDAVLITGSQTTPIGKVARDTQPFFTPSGDRAAVQSAGGLVIIERSGPRRGQ